MDTEQEYIAIPGIVYKNYRFPGVCVGCPCYRGTSLDIPSAPSSSITIGSTLHGRDLLISHLIERPPAWSGSSSSERFSPQASANHRAPHRSRRLYQRSQTGSPEKDLCPASRATPWPGGRYPPRPGDVPGHLSRVLVEHRVMFNYDRGVMC
jgi:hypothetical protein